MTGIAVPTSKIAGNTANVQRESHNDAEQRQYGHNLRVIGIA